MTKIFCRKQHLKPRENNILLFSGSVGFKVRQHFFENMNATKKNTVA